MHNSNHYLLPSHFCSCSRKKITSNPSTNSSLPKISVHTVDSGPHTEKTSLLSWNTRLITCSELFDKSYSNITVAWLFKISSLIQKEREIFTYWQIFFFFFFTKGTNNDGIMMEKRREVWFGLVQIPTPLKKKEEQKDMWKLYESWKHILRAPSSGLWGKVSCVCWTTYQGRQEMLSSKLGCNL